MAITNFDATNSNFTFLDSIESPEITLKDVTLKEAVFKALEKVDAIPRLKYIDNELVLDLDYTNKLKNLIASESDFIDKMRNQDIDFYATEMESELLNATNLSDSDEAVEIFPAGGRYTSLRSSDFIFNPLTSYIQLPKRINKIEKLYAWLENVIVSNGSKIYYQASNKAIYIDTSTSLPTLPNNDLVGMYWITIDTQDIYQTNGTTWSTTATADTMFPKIRFVDTFTNFDDTNFTGAPRQGVDFFIAQDTGLVYIYRDGAYKEITSINSNGDLLFDLTPRLLERNIYRNNDADSFIDANDRYDATKFYQSNTLYYDYRDNKIYTGNTSGLFDTNSSLEIVIDIAKDNYVFESLDNDGVLDAGETVSTISVTTTGSAFQTTIRNGALFQVFYTPIPISIRASVDRKDSDDVNRYSTLLNNQGDRIIELSNIMDNMEGKINKLGNSDLQVEHRVKDVSELFDIGDYTSDGFVVTNRELIFFKDYIYAKYDLTKNYNRLSQLIGVNSEVRQYEMGEQNTLQRKLMYSEYVEVDAYSSANSPNGVNTSRLIKDIGKRSYLSTFDTTETYQPIRSGAVTTNEITDWLLAGFSSNGGGNTLIFEMQLPNNKSAGESLQDAPGTWLQDALGLEQKAKSFKPYAKTDGTAEELRIKLFDSLSFNPTQLTDILTDSADNLPLIDETYIQNEFVGNEENGVFKIFKDNREEIGFTYSIKTISRDYSKVIFGNKLFRRNALVNESTPTGIKLYAYDTKVFDRTTTTTAPIYGVVNTNYRFTTIPNLSVNYATNKITVGSSAIDLPLNGANPQSWCLTDENDNILIAVNQGDETLDTLVFDFVNKRSDINYLY